MKNITTISDVELIQKVKSGELDFSIIYNQYYNISKKFLEKRGASNEQSDDVYQDSMITLYNKIMSNNFILTCKLSSYIFSILKRLWLKEINTKSKYINANTSESFYDSDNDENKKGNFVILKQLSYEDDFIEDDFRMLCVKKAVSKNLTPNQQKMFSLFMQEKNTEVIREGMGYKNQDALKTNKYKMLKGIKDNIRNINFDILRIVN